MHAAYAISFDRDRLRNIIKTTNQGISMRPSIETIDLDQVVSDLHSEVEDIDRHLEQIKGHLTDAGFAEIAQGGIRGFSYCLHLYYGLENTFQPEDAESFYGVPPGDIYRHFYDYSRQAKIPLIDLCGDSLNRYIEPLNPSWHNGLEATAVNLLKSTAAKIENLQKHTRSLPFNIEDEAISLAAESSVPKKQNSPSL